MSSFAVNGANRAHQLISRFRDQGNLGPGDKTNRHGYPNFFENAPGKKWLLPEDNGPQDLAPQDNVVLTTREDGSTFYFEEKVMGDVTETLYINQSADNPQMSWNRQTPTELKNLTVFLPKSEDGELAAQGVIWDRDPKHYGESHNLNVVVPRIPTRKQD